MALRSTLWESRPVYLPSITFLVPHHRGFHGAIMGRFGGDSNCRALLGEVRWFPLIPSRTRQQ